MNHAQRHLWIAVIAVALVAGLVVVACYADQAKNAAKANAMCASCPMMQKGVGHQTAMDSCPANGKKDGAAASKSCPMMGKGPMAVAPSHKVQNAKTITLKLSGPVCQTCVDRIAGSLRAVPGVGSAKVSLKPAQAVVVYDSKKTNPAALKSAVRHTAPVHAGQKFDAS